MFIACGGLEVLVDFLDLNYKQNQDLIISGIDCLNLIRDCKFMGMNDFVALLTFHNAIERIVYIIDALLADSLASVQKNQTLINSLDKAMDLLFLFSLVIFYCILNC
jgi:hypothetical protein